MGLSTFDFRNRNFNCTCWVSWIFNYGYTVPRVRKLPGHNLNTQNTKRKAVQLVSVDWLISQCFWGHVYCCSWAQSGWLCCDSHHKASPFQSLSLWPCCLQLAIHCSLTGLDGQCHWSGGRKGPGLCHGRGLPQCGRGVVHGIAPGIGSNSHPLTPLGALAALTQDHGMCLNTGQ